MFSLVSHQDSPLPPQGRLAPAAAPKALAVGSLASLPGPLAVHEDPAAAAATQPAAYLASVSRPADTGGENGSILVNVCWGLDCFLFYIGLHEAERSHGDAGHRDSTPLPSTVSRILAVTTA